MRMLVEVVSVAKCMAQRRACEFLLAADETKGILATCWTLGFTIRVSYNNLGCSPDPRQKLLCRHVCSQAGARQGSLRVNPVFPNSAQLTEVMFSYAKSRELVSVRMVRSPHGCSACGSSS